MRCGLIIDGERLYRCRNTLTRENTSVSAMMNVRTRRGDCCISLASGRYAFLSGANRNAQVSMDFRGGWLAMVVIMKFRPVPLLLGRKLKHGVMDCYTLFRMRIIFAELTFLTSNANGWWLRGENLYLNNIALSTASAVSIGEEQRVTSSSGGHSRR